jgi:hypothetical protein
MPSLRIAFHRRHAYTCLPFIVFGAGMASVLAGLAVVAGSLTVDAVRRGRKLTRLAADVGAVLVLLSGSYVVYYWPSTGRVLLA